MPILLEEVLVEKGKMGDGGEQKMMSWFYLAREVFFRAYRAAFPVFLFTGLFLAAICLVNLAVEIVEAWAD